MEELSVSKIAEFIFVNDPKPKHSIQLISDEADSEYIFELLLNILLEGLYVLYGPDFDINNISFGIFLKLNQYLNSIGFKINKYDNKKNMSYCTIKKTNDKHKPYIFVINIEYINNLNINEKLDYYLINIGTYQISFDYFHQ